MAARQTIKRKEGQYTLTIPLDASGVEDLDSRSQALKVVGRDEDGVLHSAAVKLDAKGQGRAVIKFDAEPGAVQVAVGPESTGDEELFGLQTLNFRVTTRQWKEERSLTLSPVLIPPYYWHWWLRWCRTFTIRGRVVCPDGSPVPGAKVCAFDVDWWFVWTSTQQVGCATTDINGAFSITFRWCCGWWPWWWWRYRLWRVDPGLIERVRPVFERAPEIELSAVGNQPSLKVFERIVGDGSLPVRDRLRPGDVALLPETRIRLLERLPNAPELAQLHIWPWYPWQPWWDCTPDIIFRVTQDCDGTDTVILQESVGDTRWNIDNPLYVTLVAETEACCRPLPCLDQPCDEGECIIVDQVCHFEIKNVGGNLDADPTPAGYANPGPVPPNTLDYHRPFAGIIPVYKNPGDLINVDYYEIEVFDGGWTPLESAYPGTALDFKRRYWDTAALLSKPADFPVTVISGRAVTETREHYETGSGLTWDAPGADAWWLSPNWNLLIPFDTTQLPDGTHRFRVVAWDLNASGNLVNRRVLPICGSDDDNELVLTIDNRTTDPLTHDPAHNCGAGVHVCTPEPDCHISGVRINGVSVAPCDMVDATTGTLEIDFMVHDPDGHLGHYTLHSSWGLNNSRNLLNRPGVSMSPGPSGWAAGQSTGNYGTALTQGAVPPHWFGGTFTLTMPVSEAFPEPCCYQLELKAEKRTVVGGKAGILFVCNGVHRNWTEYSLGVGVCGPVLPPIIRAERVTAGRNIEMTSVEPDSEG
jgi:hypothetical protein